MDKEKIVEEMESFVAGMLAVADGCDLSERCDSGTRAATIRDVAADLQRLIERVKGDGNG